MRRQDWRSEIQYYRGVLVQPLPGKQAKAPLPRELVSAKGTGNHDSCREKIHVRNLGDLRGVLRAEPEKQAEDSTRVRKDTERNAVKQAEAHVARVAKVERQ